MYPQARRTLAILALILPFLGQAFAQDKFRPGDTPPPRLGVTIDGKEIETGQHAGKVLVVTFWASWCGPCRKELPLLEGIQRAGKDKVQVVAVNIEDRDKFRQISKALAPSLTLTLTHDFSKQSSDAYGVKGIPHLVIIGRDGKIIKIHRGYSEDSVESILAEINGALAAS